MNRSLSLTMWLGYAGAVALALCAVSMFREGQIVAGWGLLFGGFILAFAGVSAHNVLRDYSGESTRRNNQIELLHEQLDRQRSAVDALADGLDVAVFICDPRANVLYANLRSREMFRFEDPVGRSVLAVTLSYDLERLILDAVQQREPQGAELSFSYPDERVGVARAWLQSDNEDRVFLSIYEITRLRRLERVRQDFVSNVSHELRTPLTLIRAMAETLLDDDRPEEAQLRRYLSQIIGEVDRLATLSNDLLILSSAESNPIRKQACDIASVYKSVIGQLEQKARAKGLELVYEGPEKNLLIEANSAQMTQVALNLIDNAINYSVAGQIRVQVQSGDPVEIRVSDQGFGISSEHLPRIFERFYRIDKGRSRMTGGTGLGLSIVKHLVESHGGTIGVESTLNRGSTFTITLPVGRLESVDAT